MPRHALRDGSRRLAWAVGVAVVVMARMSGAFVGVVPTKLIVLDKGASGGKTVFLAKDAAIQRGNGTDPSTIWVQLLIRYDNGIDVPSLGVFTVPSGLANSWVAFNEKVARYVNREVPTEAKVVVIKPGKLAKLVGEGLGELDLQILGQDGAPTGVAKTALCVSDSAAPFGDCFCSELSGCTWKSIAGGTRAKLVCRGGTADPTCGALTPPTTTTSTVVTSTTTTTDPPRPVCCSVTFPNSCRWTGTAADCVSHGGTPGPAGSICQPTGVCAAPPVLSGLCCANILSLGGACSSIASPTPSSDCSFVALGTPVPNAVCLPDGSCALSTDMRCCDGYAGDYMGDVCFSDSIAVADCLNGFGGTSAGLPGAPATSCSGGGDCLLTPTPGRCCLDVSQVCYQTGESCDESNYEMTFENSICSGTTCVTP